MIRKVAVVGLGKLGLPIATAMASVFPVVGIDTDPEVVDAVNRGVNCVREPGLDEPLRAAVHGGWLRAITWSGEARDADIAFVVVNTPQTGDRLDHGAVWTAVNNVIHARVRDGFRLRAVVVMSTVEAGFWRRLYPTFRCMNDYDNASRGYVYNPDFVALGSVYRDFMHPEYILCGCVDDLSRDIITEFYTRLMAPRTPPLLCMSVESAEWAKLWLNNAVRAKIALANMAAECCERTPGADAADVVRLLAMDSRIGPKYLRPGLGYAGTCFPRDGVALRASMEDAGIPYQDTARVWSQTVDNANDRVLLQIMMLFDEALDRSGIRRVASVGVLGLAFKVGSPVTANSQALQIARALGARYGDVVYYDPLVQHDGAWNGLTQMNDPQAVIDQSDVVVVMMPDPAYRALDYTDKVVVDVWRLLDREPHGAKVIVRRGEGLS